MKVERTKSICKDHFIGNFFLNSVICVVWGNERSWYFVCHIFTYFFNWIECIVKPFMTPIRRSSLLCGEVLMYSWLYYCVLDCEHFNVNHSSSKSKSHPVVFMSLWESKLTLIVKVMTSLVFISAVTDMLLKCRQLKAARINASIQVFMCSI